MQFAKDSFFVALSERLGLLNPQRTVSIGGSTRPAVVVTENEMPTAALAPERVFMISWGPAKMCKDFTTSAVSLIELECSISYGTSGSSEDGMDRGRLLTTLDSELLQICTPPFTEKRDYTGADHAPRGGNIFWTAPEIENRKVTTGGQSISRNIMTKTPLYRIATLSVFFYPEVVSND